MAPPPFSALAPEVALNDQHGEEARCHKPDRQEGGGHDAAKEGCAFFGPPMGATGNGYCYGGGRDTLLPPSATAAERLDPMQRRLWMDPALEEYLSVQSHWAQVEHETLAARAGAAGGIPGEIYGYTDIISLAAPSLHFACEPALLHLPQLAPSLRRSFRARRISDNRLYILDVFHNVPIADPAAIFAAIEQYTKRTLPFVVQITEAFTSKALEALQRQPAAPGGGNDTTALVIVVEDAVVRGALPVDERIRQLAHLEGLSQRLVSWIHQILWMLYSVHAAGLTTGSILHEKNLLTSPTLDRTFLHGLGAAQLLSNISRAGKEASTQDVVEDEAQTLRSAQRRDYEQMRAICDSLLTVYSQSTGSVEGIAHLGGWLSTLPTVWSYRYESLGEMLLACGALSSIFADVSTHCSLLEGQLIDQMDNGRLFRLICKLSFINERQSHAHDQRWSETGDRYILKLFRDYLFHSQNEIEQPIINVAHVIDTLDKLDGGSREIIMLMSRDASQCIFASFHEIKQKLEGVFEELASAAIPSSPR